MSDREIAVRRMAESLDLPPEVTDEVLTWPSMFGPEPIQFPAPRDPESADMIEFIADSMALGAPHKTLIERREFAVTMYDWMQS